MAEKKGILVIAQGLAKDGLNAVSEKLGKKACILVHAEADGLMDGARTLGGVVTTPEELEATLQKHDFVVLEGDGAVVGKSLEACNRRTLLVIALKDGVLFYGMGIDSKKGVVNRSVRAEDVLLTIATLVDLPITEECTASVIYQVLKDPNVKLNEIIKLREALARMESVLERNNREPWDKHDCA